MTLHFTLSSVSQYNITVFKGDREIPSSWMILMQGTFGIVSILFIKVHLFFFDKDLNSHHSWCSSNVNYMFSN